jgi:hypothetical protein
VGRRARGAVIARRGDVKVHTQAKLLLAAALVLLVAGGLGWLSIRSSSGVIAILGAVFAVASAAIVWKLPKLQVPDAVTDPKARAELENSSRDILIKTVAGIFLFSGAYATWSQLQITQEGNITQRFNNAISHLGADRGKELPRIIGAIYALERIASDSERDHWPIIEVLTAYVRQTAPFPSEAREKACEWQGKRAGEVPLDIQAVLTVISRRKVRQDKPKAVLDLSAVDLRYAYLMEAKLDGAFFFAANLCGAWLRSGSTISDSAMSGISA